MSNRGCCTANISRSIGGCQTASQPFGALEYRLEDAYSGGLHNLAPAIDTTQRRGQPKVAPGRELEALFAPVLWV